MLRSCIAIWLCRRAPYCPLWSEYGLAIEVTGGSKSGERGVDATVSPSGSSCS